MSDGSELTLSTRSQEAAWEARHLNHNCIGTQHLLLGLLREGDGVAAGVLNEVGVGLDDARHYVRMELAPVVPAPTPKATVPTADRTGTSQKPAYEKRGEHIHSIYTPRAQLTLAYAREEADRLQQPFVGTEHLLLGLLRLGQWPAYHVLDGMGLDLETVRTEVAALAPPGSEPKLVQNKVHTPRLQKILALAAKEARALRHTYVGTEHLFLALLREGDGVPATILKNHGADIAATRKKS